MNMHLIIATKNKGKLKEIKKILKHPRLEIISLADLPHKFFLKETGKTFLENALCKAIPVSKFYKDDLVAGEDSGLEVEYLGGLPGIFSKRYSGKNSTDLKNNKKLLRALSGVEKNKRKAHFHCVIALCKNGKLIKSFEGQLKGVINDKMQGNNGFGYDPVFYLNHYKKTVAQLPAKVKNRISHRAKAFRKLDKYLARISKNK